MELWNNYVTHVHFNNRQQELSPLPTQMIGAQWHKIYVIFCCQPIHETSVGLSVNLAGAIHPLCTQLYQAGPSVR